MKRKLLPLIATLLVIILAGCAALAAETNKVENNPNSAQGGAQTKPAETKPATTTTTTTKTKKTVAQVKKIAFDHAKVKESATRDLEVELDKEKGKEIYEITFESGGYDYEYDIDAYSGKILFSEKERDD